MSTSSTALVPAVAGVHAFPNFYACYLLRSLKKNYKSRTYVGSTPNPARRLRQHNGELTAGARKTARYRPWEMVCIVHGFPSQLAALQFEWAWQNPHISRQMPQATKQVLHRTREDRDTSPGQRRRGAKGRNRRLRPSLTMAGKLANMHTMLTLDAWKRWPLHVRIFADDVWETWHKHLKKKNVPSLPPWITTELDLQQQAPTEAVVPSATIGDTSDVELPLVSDTELATASKSKRSKKAKVAKSPTKKTLKQLENKTIGGVTNLDVLDKNLRDLSKDKLEFIKLVPMGQLKCQICAQGLSSTEQGKVVICPETDCQHISHIPCLGQQYLAEEPQSLLPTRGSCPGCGKTHSWGELIKGAQFRHLLHTKGNVEVNEDEFADLEFDGNSGSSDESMSDATSSEDVPLKSESSNMPVTTARKGPKSKPMLAKSTTSPSRTPKARSPSRSRKSQEEDAAKVQPEDKAGHEILVID